MMAAKAMNAQQHLPARGDHAAQRGRNAHAVVHGRRPHPHVQQESHAGQDERHALQQAQGARQLVVDELPGKGHAQDAGDAQQRHAVQHARAARGIAGEDHCPALTTTAPAGWSCGIGTRRRRSRA
ncbi:hypothetical protein G6F31_019636 [Rhizopus arrhizus]|nr:hypothetical protein G6F31_019636 [Rhizopus arrhizus]